MYLRKSRTDLEAEAHKEGDTLLRHEVLLKDLAQRQSFTITKIYKEIVSGETIAARPVMQKLLQEVEQGIWNGVLVMEIERLARGDTIDQGMVAQAFKYSETKIITPLKIYDPSNEYDEEYFEFGLFMSRREFKTINRRIQRGRIASVNEGKFISSTPPYGYFKQKLTNEKGYTLLPHPDDSKVVKLIYEWYTTGYQHSNGTVERLGCLKIAGLLNSMRYKPPKAKAWSKSTILDILKNPVYIGYIRWQYRKEVTSIVDNQPKKYRSYTGDCLLVKGLHKSIISEEVYQKAQTHFKNKSLPPIPGNRSITNPLLGILYCGKCGRHLTRLSKNNKAPYDLIKCMNPNCDNISSPLSLVEEQILKGLEQWVKNYTFNPPCLSDILSPLSSIIESKEDYIKDIISQIQRKEKSFEKICEYLEEGVYSREEFQRRKLLILKSIEELNYTYMFLSDELKQLNLQKEKNITIPEIKSLSSLYYSLTTPSKNEFLKNLLEKVEYQKDHRNRKGDALRCNFILNIYPKIINIP
jgi:DNA invertase Pin-like site-specific DNA recombinase